MKKIVVLLLAYLFFASQTRAQVRGIITDAHTGEALIGVTVVNAEDPKDAVFSGLDGSFSLNPKKAQILLRFSYIGYTPKELTANATRELLKIQLEPAATSLLEIVVKGAADKESSARDIEKNAPNVINTVSSRAIEVSPDYTVANVIQRVSGITVERTNTGDGQYALLRGMDKRYNYTLVNGVKIPSPDNKNRFVPLDIFPAEMLERLEVTKSVTPDMEGDGVGGAINLVMKDAPANRMISGNIATGFNTLFFDRAFQSYDKSIINPKSPYELYGSSYPARPRDFNPRLFDIREKGVQPNLFAGLSAGDRFFRKRLGVLIAATYQNSVRGSNSTDFPYSTATSDASNLPVLSSVSKRAYSEQQIRSGTHAKLDYRISSAHKLSWYNAYMLFQVYQVRDQQKTDFSIGYDPANHTYNLAFDTRLRYTRQQIYNSTLKGEHSFSDRFSADWSAVYSKARSELPENSSIHLVTTVKNGVQNPRSVVTLGGAERRWEHNSDEDKAAYLNLHYRAGTNFPVLISAGGLYRDKQRENFFNEYTFRPYDESKPAGTQNNLIEGVDWNTFSEIQFMVFTPYGSTGNPLNYNATEKITAGYLQGKLAHGKTEALGGVRIEKTEQGYFLRYPVAGVSNEGEQVYTDILPGLHLKYQLSAVQNLRLSYYKAINRPSFFEIVPYRIINEEFTEAGNPDLKHTVADNIDFRYEFFPKAAEQLMAGLFYKNIKDPIEYGLVVQGQGTFYMPVNFGTAVNYGAEIDFTKYLYSFGVKANYTYTHSNITTTKLFFYNNPNPESTEKVLAANVDQRRRLAGQAAHVANLTLLYKSVRKGIDGQISLTYTGNRLYAVSRYLDNDLWQDGFVQMDISAEKRFAKQFVLFFKAINVLDTPVKLYVNKVNAANARALDYKEYNGKTLVRTDTYGQNLLLGLRFKF